MSSIRHGSGRLFSIDAPGGTGKTMLLKTVIDQARQEGYVAIATALTGVAAILLPGGRTVHSKLKVPIDSLTEDSLLQCTGKKDGTRALLENASLLIIDEATMMERRILNAINRTLCRFNNTDKPFGGLTLVLSGDWRQTLPVIPGAPRAEIVSETLKGTKYLIGLIFC